MRNKPFLFLAVFMVSFMVMYSVYYYSQISRLERGVVAEADSLRHTQFVASAGTWPATGNVVYSAGLEQALRCGGTCEKTWDTSLIHHRYQVGFAGNYSEIILEKLDAQLVDRMDKHPPLALAGIRDKDRVLFGYLLRHIILPESFIVSDEESLTFGNQERQALRHRPVSPFVKDTGTATLFLDKGEKTKLLRVYQNAGKEEIYWLTSDKNLSGPEALMTEVNRLQGLPAHTFTKEEEVRLPVLDYFFSKTYTPDALPSGAGMEYDKGLEYLKLKTTAGYLNSSEEKRYFAGIRKLYDFGEGTYFILKRRGASQPYLIMRLQDPEVLVPL